MFQFSSARFKAGRSWVLPPPRCFSIVAIAFEMFPCVAGRERSDMIDDPPAKRSTLNTSEERRLLIRSLRSFFDVSRGNPCIEPEISTIKIYSRPGISFKVN